MILFPYRSRTFATDLSIMETEAKLANNVATHRRDGWSWTKGCWELYGEVNEAHFRLRPDIRTRTVYVPVVEGRWHRDGQHTLVNFVCRPTVPDVLVMFAFGVAAFAVCGEAWWIAGLAILGCHVFYLTVGFLPYADASEATLRRLLGDPDKQPILSKNVKAPFKEQQEQGHPDGRLPRR